MTKSPYLIKIHFFFLGVVILETIIRVVSGIGFISWFDNSLKGLVVITAIYISIKYFKEIGVIKYYFAAYFVSIFIGCASLILGGMLGALYLSFLLFPFQLNSVAYEKDDVRIYYDSKGFLSACCNYNVVEKKLFILEGQIGEFENEGEVDFKKAKVKRLEKGVELVFQQEVFDENINDFITRNKRVELIKQRKNLRE